jgi:hypothetical protein
VVVSSESLLRFKRSLKLAPVTEDDAAAKALTKNPLGKSGHVVAENIERLRTRQNLTFSALSDRLEQIGRPIPTLGLRKIVAKTRRVDVDDLVGLALALGVSPITFLLPLEVRAGEPVQPDDMVGVTGLDVEATASQLWRWLTADDTLHQTRERVRIMNGPVSRSMFVAAACPEWVQEVKRKEDGARLDEMLGYEG